MRAIGLLILLSTFAWSQEPQQIPVQLQQARAQFGASTSLKTVILSGTFIDGEETGTFNAAVSVDGTFRLVLSGKRNREESARAGKSGLSCFSSIDGKEREAPKQNCLDPVNWILPLVTLQSTSKVKMSEVSTANRLASVGVDLDLAQQRVNSDPKSSIGRSVLRISEDAQTPKALTLSRFADDDLGIEVPVSVTYSDYRTAAGLLIPFQISRTIRGSVLTLNVSNVTVE
jgi:hypothetical protein